MAISETLSQPQVINKVMIKQMLVLEMERAKTTMKKTDQEEVRKILADMVVAFLLIGETHESV